MGQGERADLLAAVLEAIADVRRDTPSKDAFDALSKTVTSQGDSIEEIRRNAKGANNWGKIASGVGAAAPLLVAVLKAAGWL